MTWVAIAVGGTALVGAGASYLGAKKQAGAARDAAGLQMDQFNLINRQQQPYIQSGYGAMSRLNTLLGLSPNPYRQARPGGQMPGNQMRIQPYPRSSGMRLDQLLAMRAANGDRQAQQMLTQRPVM